MNRVALITALMLACATPALAQPIESAPLAAPTYTMQGETDPMATGSAPPQQAFDDVPPPINRGEAAPATPPPGADSLPTQDVAPITSTPPQYTGERAMAPVTSPAANTPYTNPYPNNSVSGVPPEDTSKFENRVFCTLKVSFGSMGTGPDRKTGDKVKSYLDSNLDKLSYQTLNWGKEGEFSYCTTIKQHRDQAKIYSDLRRIIPDQRNNTAPVTLSGKGFEPAGNKRRATND